MPINLTPNLPDEELLKRENVFTMSIERALHQDIRPLEIAILNIMPLKEQTELQILRMLGNSPLQTHVTFVSLETHESTHVSKEHMDKHYVPFPRSRTISTMV